MKERPVLFSGPMVRAILAGAKTQTRRPVTWRGLEPGTNLGFSGLSAGHWNTGCPETGHVLYSRGSGGVWQQRSEPTFCPLGQPGEMLWVRETFAVETCREVGATGYDPPHRDGRPVRWTDDVEWGRYWEQAHYRATDPDPELSYAPDDDEPRVKWTPSIHMPRWASRITLRITDVRVERVRDISEADAKAEGMPITGAAKTRLTVTDTNGSTKTSTVSCHFFDAKMCFFATWAAIYGDKHPCDTAWCWAVTFERVDSATFSATNQVQPIASDRDDSESHLLGDDDLHD